MASSGSFQTSVASTSPLALKLMSVALFAQTQKQPGFSRVLTGPAPTDESAKKKLRGQTSPDMPVVRVTDLSKTAGDKISVDMFGTIGGKPIVGDADAEGTGAALANASMDVEIDLLTKVVDVGGKMTQQRTRHDLRSIAMANLVSYFARLDDQLTLVHLAGARGSEDNTDWVVPLASDADFGAICVNDVKAPTYDRHFVVDGSSLAQGGVNLGSLETTDFMTLDHIDGLRTLLDEMVFPLQPVKIADDPAAADEPMWVMYLSPRQYSKLLTNSSATGIRAFQQNAWNRASYGSKHPLFKGEVGMWNGILVKKATRAIRFASGSSAKIVTAANAANATETTQAISANITAAYAVDRALLLGGQALANVYGRNQGSDYHTNWMENPYNFGRALEVAGDTMGGKAKLRFKMNNVTTDHGVIVLDSVVQL